VKRREFLISGVCTVGALVAARSLFASPEPPAYRPVSSTSPGYHLHGSARRGCARLPSEELIWESLATPTTGL